MLVILNTFYFNCRITYLLENFNELMDKSTYIFSAYNKLISKLREEYFCIRVHIIINHTNTFGT